jgi:predicted alpha/beta-fold hydrolase
VLNYRGAGGTVLTTPAVTSAATTEDVALALSVIGAQCAHLLIWLLCMQPCCRGLHPG